jgi:hypothetical protein
MGKEVSASSYEEYVNLWAERGRRQELLKLYSRAREACAPQIDAMGQILAELRPSPPYRYYRGPTPLGDETALYHSATYRNLVDVLRAIWERDGGFSTSRRKIIVSHPETPIPKSRKRWTSIITTRAVEVLPLDDPRVQLYVHTQRLIEALSGSDYDYATISFLIAEATGEGLPLVKDFSLSVPIK